MGRRARHIAIACAGMRQAETAPAMKSAFLRFLSDDHAASALDHGVVLCLLAVGAVGSAESIGQMFGHLFGHVTALLDGANMRIGARR